MKTGHKILIALGVLSFYLVLIARADPPVRKLLNYSLNVSNGFSTANAANGTNLTHFVDRCNQFWVYVGTSNNDTSTSNTVVTLYPTPDGVRTNTAQALTLTLANTGTLYASVTTNFSSGGLSEYFVTVSNATKIVTSTNFVDVIFNQKSGL